MQNHLPPRQAHTRPCEHQPLHAILRREIAVDLAAAASDQELISLIKTFHLITANVKTASFARSFIPPQERLQHALQRLRAVRVNAHTAKCDPFWTDAEACQRLATLAESLADWAEGIQSSKCQKQ